MQKLSGNNEGLIETKSKYVDSVHWNEMFNKHLPSYTQPRYKTPCTVEHMEWWLYRLGVSKKEFCATGNYSGLEEFISLNPEWSLRAFIGLCLELKEYK